MGPKTPNLMIFRIKTSSSCKIAGVRNHKNKTKNSSRISIDVPISKSRKKRYDLSVSIRQRLGKRDGKGKAKQQAVLQRDGGSDPQPPRYL